MNGTQGLFDRKVVAAGICTFAEFPHTLADESRDHPGKEMITVTGPLKKVECDPKCGFMVRSHDEKEIIEIAMDHAKKFHEMAITAKDVKGMMKDA